MTRFENKQGFNVSADGLTASDLSNVWSTIDVLPIIKKGYLYREFLINKSNVSIVMYIGVTLVGSFRSSNQ